MNNMSNKTFNVSYPLFRLKDGGKNSMRG